MERAAAPQGHLDVSRHRLQDGRIPFDVRAYTLEPPPDNSEASLHVAFANGLYENDEIWRLAIWRLAKVARANHVGLKAFAYDDPWVGRAAHGQAYRTERLAEVVTYAADMCEAPVLLAPQSRGMISSIEVATDLYRPQAPNDTRVAGILGISPAGLSPRSPEQTKDVSIVGWALWELVAPGNVSLLVPKRPIIALGSLRSLRHLVTDGVLPHLATSPLGARQEILEILQADKLDELAELHDKGLPLRIWGASQDKLCPSSMIQANLKNHGLPVDSLFVEQNTSHCGPVIDPAYTRPLFEELTALQSRAAPAKAGRVAVLDQLSA